MAFRSRLSTNITRSRPEEQVFRSVARHVPLSIESARPGCGVADVMQVPGPVVMRNRYRMAGALASGSHFHPKCHKTKPRDGRREGAIGITDWLNMATKVQHCSSCAFLAPGGVLPGLKLVPLVCLPPSPVPWSWEERGYETGFEPACQFPSTGLLCDAIALRA